MYREDVRGGWWLFCGLVCWGISGWQAAWAEEHSHVVLPPSWGGTVWSFGIEAQAKYMAGQADLIESIAVARKIHAEAVALEIENWRHFVNNYFQTRADAHDWRRKEDPNFDVRADRIQKKKEWQMQEQMQELVKGDPTAHLNWLLTELSTRMAWSAYLSPEERPKMSDLDPPLTPDELNQIRFSDGGLRNSKLIIRANDPTPLSDPWPLGLRAPAFADARNNFDSCRDAVLKEIKDGGQASHENAEKLREAVTQIKEVMEAAYSREDRQDPSMFLTFNAARNFIELLKLQVRRVVTSRDTASFDGTLGFKEGSLLELVQHMYRCGLLFAPPEPGGERVYRALFERLRNIYVRLNAASGKPEPKAAPGKF